MGKAGGADGGSSAHFRRIQQPEPSVHSKNAVDDLHARQELDRADVSVSTQS